MSAHGGKGGKRRGGHEEEHENHERWAVSYGDMMTVLVALFIVLFAISQVDQQKFVQLRNSLATSFGQQAVFPVDGGTGLLTSEGTESNPVGLDVGAVAAVQGDVASIPNLADTTTDNAKAAVAEAEAAEQAENEEAAREEAARLQQIQAEIQGALAAEGLSDRAQFQITERGLVVGLVADEVFFASASAVIEPTGRTVLDGIAPVLRDLPEDIAVEGHTNDLPISTAVYPSNWELSAGRASSVVRYLVDVDGIAAIRLSAVGYGETRPRYAAGDARAIEGNRRVDLVIESDESAAVRELVPTIANAPQGLTP